MSKFIEEFYFGNIEPMEMGENERASRGKWHDLEEHGNKITAQLDENGQSSFKAYEAIWNDLLCASTTDSFVNGFRIGAKFTYDAFLE